jgi:hypothetical protein
MSVHDGALNLQPKPMPHKIVANVALKVYHLLCCSCWGHSHCSKYCIFVQFRHAFSILHHCMHLCPAALPGSLARQPCPAALPVRLARQPCPAALPVSLDRQPCRKVCKLFYGRSLGRHACSIAYFYSAGSFVQAFPAIKDIAILSLVYKL